MSLLLGCRQIVGVEPRQTPAPVCGLPASPTDACDQCMQQGCCAQLQQCADAAGCGEVAACVDACAFADAACLYGCTSAPGKATEAQATVSSCRASACGDVCLPERWSCLGRVALRAPNPALPTVVIRTRVIDYGNLQPVPDVRARLCFVADPGCDSPIVGGQSDAQGQVTLSFTWYSRFATEPQPVFIELHKDGLVDALVTMGTPAPYFDLNAGDWGLGSIQSFDGYVAAAGAVRDPVRAVVGIGVLDCNFQLAGGVRITSPSADGQATIFYADVDTTPNPARTETVDGGATGIVNLPVDATGRARIEARVAATGALIGTTEVVVRAGATSNTVVTPAP